MAIQNDTTVTKECTACNQIKPLPEFYSDKGGKYGVRSWCKPCFQAKTPIRNLTPDAIERRKLQVVRFSMIDRCYNPQSTGYKYYGGRGITVCQRWLDSLDDFLADMGPRPTGYQIDRTDNDAGYSPENCRWVTRAENCQNRRVGSNNKTGTVGVCMRKDGVYTSEIIRNGIRLQKAFKQRWDAICQRKSWEAQFNAAGTLEASQ